MVGSINSLGNSFTNLNLNKSLKLLIMPVLMQALTACPSVGNGGSPVPQVHVSTNAPGSSQKGKEGEEAKRGIGTQYIEKGGEITDCTVTPNQIAGPVSFVFHQSENGNIFGVVTHSDTDMYGIRIPADKCRLEATHGITEGIRYRQEASKITRREIVRALDTQGIEVDVANVRRVPDADEFEGSYGYLFQDDAVPTTGLSEETREIIRQKAIAMAQEELK